MKKNKKEGCVLQLPLLSYFFKMNRVLTVNHFFDVHNNFLSQVLGCRFGF